MSVGARTLWFSGQKKTARRVFRRSASHWFPQTHELIFKDRKFFFRINKFSAPLKFSRSHSSLKFRKNPVNRFDDDVVFHDAVMRWTRWRFNYVGNLVISSSLCKHGKVVSCKEASRCSIAVKNIEAGENHYETIIPISYCHIFKSVPNFLQIL